MVRNLRIPSRVASMLMLTLVAACGGASAASLVDLAANMAWHNSAPDCCGRQAV